MKKPKPAADCKTCATCESYKPVSPGDDAGYCHLMPPIWIETDGVGEWTHPVVTPDESCRFWLQKLNS